MLKLTLLAWGGTGSLLAQDAGNEARLLLMASRAEFQQFYRQKQEFARSKELERTNIPQYNIDLSLTVRRFHKHISDMHQTSCDLFDLQRACQEDQGTRQED
jgi:hypothetical protein